MLDPTRTPFDFVGDFVFQQARREEKVNVIDTIVQRCLHFFSFARGGKMSIRVLIYRNDYCSEGQYYHVRVNLNKSIFDKLFSNGINI